MPAPAKHIDGALLYGSREVTYKGETYLALDVSITADTREEIVNGADNEFDAAGQWNNPRRFSATISARTGKAEWERNETFTCEGVDWVVTQANKTHTGDSHTKYAVAARELKTPIAP